MHKPFVKKSAFLTASFLLLSFMLTFFSPVAGSVALASDGGKGNTPVSSGKAPVQGNDPKSAQHGQEIGHTDANTNIDFTISLKLRNEDLLNAIIEAQSNPSSAWYKRYLSTDEFRQLFAPSGSDVAKVIAFLQRNGLTVTQVIPERTLLRANGSAANIETAFSTRVNNYQNAKGQRYYAHADVPQVPTAINGLFQSVNISNEPSYKRTTSLNAADPHVGSGPAGGYTPSELRGAYDVNPLISAGYNGTGQTVALFELDGFQQSNINQYVSQYGLGSPTPTTVLVDGYNGAAGQGQVEVELDIEVIEAMAPKAGIKVYEGPNSSAGVLDTYQKIATNNTEKSISTSWGLCELDSSTSDINSLHTVFSQMASQGQSIFSASGDSGAYDCKPNGGANANKLAVDSPSDDPFVTAVGGTRLNLSGTTYSSESVWSNTSNSSGGGGGLSSIYAKPSYQTGSGVTNTYSNGKRELPDVSADADPASGYSIYSQGSWTVVGGTSAAAPLWAGITALNNQYAAANGKANLGQANPALYGLFNATQTYPAFHDVTSGNNLYYPATSGYDLATGIGTPDAWNLIRDLNGSTGGGGCTSNCGGGTATELIQNGGFESAGANWTEASSGGYEITDTTLPHTGAKSAYLCGYNNCSDSLYQTISVPASATSVTLTFYTYVSTQETSHSYDFFKATIRNSSNTVLKTAVSLSDATATGWTKQTVDLTSYKGQSIRVYFGATTDSSATTSFFVDDVSVIAK